jgi:putative exporter of polyketide antibiotics
MAHPEQWRYPYVAVGCVWVLLAVLLAVLYLILSPASFPYSWRRLLAAFAYSALLILLGIPSVATDLPGYYYVPAMFSVVTMGGVLALAVASAVCALLSGGKGAA